MDIGNLASLGPGVKLSGMSHGRAIGLMTIISPMTQFYHILDGGDAMTDPTDICIQEAHMETIKESERVLEAARLRPRLFCGIKSRLDKL